MIKKYLNAKHWQVFLLTSSYLILQPLIFWMTAFLHEKYGMSLDTFSPFLTIPLIYKICGIFLISWHWSIVFGLSKVIPNRLLFNLNPFILVTIASFLFMTLSIILGIKAEFAWSLFEANIAPFVLAFISIFISIYSIYIVAKFYKTALLKKEVKFNEFAGDFVLFLFYPFGIWILQPKINKLIR